MARYFIETSAGRKGPFNEDVIRQGLENGTVPPNARLIVEESGKALHARDLTRSTEPAKPPKPAFRPPAPRRKRFTGPVAAAPQPGYPPPGGVPYPGNQGIPNPQAPQPYGAQYAPYPPPIPRPTSGWAIASLVCSLVTLVICLPTFIVGIIGGLVALKECEPHGPKQGRGLALAGIWTGVGLGVPYIALTIWFVSLFAR